MREVENIEYYGVTWSNQAVAEYGVTPFNSNSNGTIDVPFYNNAYSMNTNSTTYVAWNWLGGGAASTNNNGAIQSSVSDKLDVHRARWFDGGA